MIAGTTSLGTLVVYLQANASQYQRAMKSVEMDTAMRMEAAARAAKYASVAIAGSMALISAAAVREFGKFDAAMVKSLAIMGDVSDQTRAQMEDTARAISRSSITSAEKVAESYYYLASAGFDVQQSMKALPLVEKFAVAGMFDMNRATTLLADAQSALGLRTSDAAKNMLGMKRVADVLTKANIMANASVEDFSEALTTKAANALRLVNKEVEEGVAVLAAFAQQGIKAEAAGDALHQVIRDLQRASIKNREDWDDFNLSIFDGAGKMRHLADIVEQLEKALGPMNDEQRRTTLMMLGFQDRSISATQALLGLSGQIRKYEEGLRNAGGLTEDVAGKQLKSLNAQFTILLNNVKDVLITLGGDLISIVRALGFTFGNTKTNLEELNNQLSTGALSLEQYNTKTKEVLGEQQKWEESTRKVRDTIVALALTATTVFMDVVHGWKLIVTAAQFGAAAYKLAVSGAMLAAGKLVEANIKMWNVAINKVIGVYNVAKRLMGDFSKPVEPMKFDGFDFVKELENDTKAALKDVVALGSALDTLIKDGKPSDDFLKRWEELQRKLNFGAEKTSSVWAPVVTTLRAVQTSARGAGEAITFLSPELKKLRDMLADPSAAVYNEQIKELDNVMRASLESVKKLDAALAAGKITRTQYDDEMAKNVLSAYEYDEALQKLLATQNQFIKPVGGLSQGPLKDMTGDPIIDPFIENHNELSLLEKSFEEKMKVVDAYYDRQIKAQEGNIAEQTRLEQVRNATLERMSETYIANIDVLERKRTSLILQNSSAMFDQLASISENAFGKQSAMYKASFAASKAFAIAEATMNMYKAGAQVMADSALPFYAKIPAYLSIIANGLGIISNMQAIGMSFEGGGKTGGGSRTGGLDGRGGFMAMLHPQEEVVDHYRRGGMEEPDRGGITVLVNQTFTGGVTREDLARQSEVTKRETVGAIWDGISRGGSQRQNFKR